MRLTEFTGARRIPLIGRQDLLLEAERRIGRGGVHLLYLEGAGGIGKTAVLEAILEKSQRGIQSANMAACCIAKEVIDLYSGRVHTSEGMMRRIVDVLGKWHFEQTEEVLTGLDRARASGDMDAVSVQIGLLQTSFFEELALLAEEGVVLAFDAAEVLEYERDPFQDELDVDMPIVSAGEWLFRSFLPAIDGNVLVLLAGRTGDLVDSLEEARGLNPRLMVHHNVVEPLTPEETEQYLIAIAQAEGRRGDGDAAARLWSCGEEKGEVVHMLTGGRPALLALVADLVANDWALPSILDEKLEEVEQQDPHVWVPQVERELALGLAQSPSPIGDILQTMAWLRKGTTPELLARLLELRTPDGEWDVYTATGYLEQVAQLALVRVQSGTRRVFLHDTLYDLFEQHVLPRVPEERQAEIEAAIKRYYWDKSRELEQRIEQFPPVLNAIQARLRQAYVEEMYYRLKHSPPQGYAMYFWLAEEALGGRDTEMDMLLRTEFLRTVGVLMENDHYLGNVPREAVVDAAVRWGMRALFFRNDPERALSIFDEVRRRWGRDMGKLRLSWAHMQLYRAVAQIQRAFGEDWQEARILLDNVEQTTDDVLRAPPESPVVRGHRWQARIIRSLALNYRGYLDRQEGRHLEAIKNYQESAMLQRRLGMGALIPTLTNLAYALALTGETHHARLLSEEAERRARRSGKEQMLALTLNVRALVEAYGNHHRAALRYTDRALEVASKLPSTRIRGLIHLTRARAQRYLWDSLTQEERERDPQFYPEALKEANQAVNLLRNNPADRVDALLERGCVYRDLARQLSHNGSKEESADYAAKSRTDLERVATLAGAIDLPRQQALAWTNLGWLYYYIGERQRIEDTLELAYSPLPADYVFPAQGSVPPIAQDGRKHEATLPYWSTLGKAEMLRGFMDLDRISTNGNNRSQHENLESAVKHITLSLAYDELVADEYFELSRAEEGLHRRILGDQLSVRALHRFAEQAAEEQGLSQPTRFQGFLNRLFGPPELWD